MNTKIKIADIVIIILFLFISVFSFLSWTLLKSNGSFVLITTPYGKYEYPLNKDRILKIKGKNHYSVIEIKNNKVRFLKSKCPNKTCISFGFIQKGGASAVCIPNRVSIIVKSKRDYDTLCR